MTNIPRILKTRNFLSSFEDPSFQDIDARFHRFNIVRGFVGLRFGGLNSPLFFCRSAGEIGGGCKESKPCRPRGAILSAGHLLSLKSSIALLAGLGHNKKVPTRRYRNPLIIPRYTRPEMAGIWEPQTRFQDWF